MYRNLKISLCLPCRNEGEHLASTLKGIPDIVDEVIVISNRSTDDTVAVAKSLGATVIEEDRVINNIGYGFALMTGFTSATGDIIVSGDADGTYPFDDIAKVVDYLIDNKLNFVSCARYPLPDKSHVPLQLRLGIFLLNNEFRLLYGTKTNDILSGMWVFERSSLDDLCLSEGDWNLSPQIKVNAMTSKKIRSGEFQIVEAPRKGVSHQRYFQTGLSHAIWILKNRFSRSSD